MHLSAVVFQNRNICLRWKRLQWFAKSASHLLVLQLKCFSAMPRMLTHYSLGFDKFRELNTLLGIGLFTVINLPWIRAQPSYSLVYLGGPSQNKRISAWSLKRREIKPRAQILVLIRFRLPRRRSAGPLGHLLSTSITTYCSRTVLNRRPHHHPRRPWHTSPLFDCSRLWKR